jgi:large subunit ribosomal protein L3
MKGLLGKKIGMTRIFNEKGQGVPVTLMECGPCPVLQIKTPKKDGYQALQIGFGTVKEKRTTKAIIQHCKKAGVAPVHVMKEFPWDAADNIQLGQNLGVEIFEKVKRVDVSGISKGRGFTGTIKRYAFQRGRETHGNKNHRGPGSVGGHTFPARTWPGQRMSGRYGGEKVTKKNLLVVQLDRERNLMAVKGSVPGPNDGYLMVQPSDRKE